MVYPLSARFFYLPPFFRVDIPSEICFLTGGSEATRQRTCLPTLG
jgi:hypothetical protein